MAKEALIQFLIVLLMVSMSHGAYTHSRGYHHLSNRRRGHFHSSHGLQKRCYSSGQRCAGAPGFALMSWLGCCEKNERCIHDPKKGWGSFCLPARDHYLKDISKPGSVCYKTGERCAGAPNHPFVPRLGCCSANDMCVSDEKKGWGFFCKNIDDNASEKKESCYKDGERCDAGSGHQHVPWPGCCNKDSKCVEDKSLGWEGRFCKTGESSKTTAPTTTVARAESTRTTSAAQTPPEIKQTDLQCFKTGARCAVYEFSRFAQKSCCDSNAECVFDSSKGYGQYCTLRVTTAPPRSTSPTTYQRSPMPPTQGGYYFPQCLPRWSHCGPNWVDHEVSRTYYMYGSRHSRNHGKFGLYPHNTRRRPRGFSRRKCCAGLQCRYLAHFHGSRCVEEPKQSPLY